MATTLNGINEKVRTLEGTGRVTPIKMSDLNSRITALEGRGTYRIVTYTGSAQEWKIPDDLLDYNFCVLTFGPYYGLESNDGKSFRATERNSLTFSKSGNYIVPSSGMFYVGKVLFYK